MPIEDLLNRETPGRFSSFGTLPESEPDERDHLLARYVRVDTSGLPDECGTSNVESYPGIRDQDDEGSCTGFAFRGVKGTVERSQKGRWYRNRVPDFGPRGIYEWAKEVGGYPQEEGAYLRDVVKAAAKYGVPREADWPYVAGSKGKPGHRLKANARQYRIGAYSRVRSVDEMRLALHTVGPLFIAMELTESFMRPDAEGRVPATPSGQSYGGHAMCMVLIKASTQEALVANSWGRSWGEDGFVWLPLAHFMGVPHESWCIHDEPAA